MAHQQCTRLGLAAGWRIDWQCMFAHGPCMEQPHVGSVVGSCPEQFMLSRQFKQMCQDKCFSFLCRFSVNRSLTRGLWKFPALTLSSRHFGASCGPQRTRRFLGHVSRACGEEHAFSRVPCLLSRKTESKLCVWSDPQVWIWIVAPSKGKRLLVCVFSWHHVTQGAATILFERKI